LILAVLGSKLIAQISLFLCTSETVYFYNFCIVLELPTVDMGVTESLKEGLPLRK
jgi:hypothetical protein